jgi:hypothetical protein
VRLKVPVELGLMTLPFPDLRPVCQILFFCGIEENAPVISGRCIVMCFQVDAFPFDTMLKHQPLLSIGQILAIVADT